MKTPAPFRFNLAAGATLVTASGAAGAAAFVPALLNLSRDAIPGAALPAAIAGALVYAAVWFGFSAALAGKAGLARTEMARRLSPWFAVALLPLISYIPYLAYRTGLAGDSVELPPLGPRPAAVTLLILSLSLLAILLRMALGDDESPTLNLLTRKPAVTLGIMMAIWLAVFFTLDVLKDQYMQVTTINSAVFREAMLDVFDPRGFMFSHVALEKGASIFAAHISAILIFFIPIFRIWPDYRLMLFLSDVALALSAWPAYLIARRHFSKAVSLLLAAFLLFHPIMAAQPGRQDLSELRFAPLLFLTALYLFERKRFWLFTLCCLLLLTIREDLGLFVAFIGIYALCRRYPLKWILVPLGMGAAWFAGSVAWLLPHLSPTGTAIRSTIRYSTLGNSSSEIAKTLLFHPVKALQAAFATASHYGAAYGFFITFGLGVPLLSGSVLMAVPAVAEVMFQQTTNLVSFMSLLALPTLMFAYMNGLARLDRIANRRWQINPGRTAAVAAVVLFFVSISAFHTWFNPGMYQPRYNYDSAREALCLVPDDASVRMPEFMFVYAKPAQTLSGFHQLTYAIDLGDKVEMPDDYIVLDRHVPTRTGDDRYYRGLEAADAYIKESGDFYRAYSGDDIDLYIRLGHEPGASCPCNG
jgi:uncharacterized membrane protein